MSRDISVLLPPELHTAPRGVLESYVRARALSLAGSTAVADRLNMPPEAIVKAFAEAIRVLPAHMSSRFSEVDANEPQLQLVFRHDCLNLGCLDPGCMLCLQNPQRRCNHSCFAPKYLAGDILKAKCGASIRVEVISRTTGASAPQTLIGDVLLEECILDGKQYAALQEAGREKYEEDVEGCILLFNNQNKPLLAPGRQAALMEGHRVVVGLARGQAYLPDLSVTGSSEALLSGVKPPFRLLVRAINPDGSPAVHIRFAVSEAFVVATPRVRTAVKAEIPHVDDHVSKLQAVGIMTQNKLQDIKAAAAAVGVFGITVPHNCVTKVGQFREVVEAAEKDKPLCETLKKVLKLTKGWELARDHAMTAVGTDNQMRIWYSESPALEGGLLFKCALGSVDLENPVGLLQKGAAANGGLNATMEATLTGQLGGQQRDLARRLQRQAALAWWRAGHPGWAIWPVDTEHFMRNAQAGTSVVASEAAPTSPTPSRSPSDSSPSFRGFVAPDLGLERSVNDIAHLDNAQQAFGGHDARATSAPEPSGRPIPSTAPRGEPARGGSAPAQDLLQKPNMSGLLPNSNRSPGMPGTLEALLDRSAPARLLSSTAEAWGRESSRHALPPLSPFAETDQQAAEPDAMPPPPPPGARREGGLDVRTSEDEGHRRKRHQVNPVALQQRVSALVGRQLDERDMSRIFPSFPDLSLPDGLAALPCAPFSGSMANGMAAAAESAAAPPPPLLANGDDGGLRDMLTPLPSMKAGETSGRGGAAQPLQGARSSGMFALDFGEPELLALLAGPADPGALRSQDSALLAAYVKDCLAAEGASPGALPKLASGLSYGRLLRSRGSDLGNPRPSAGLESMQSMEAALHNGKLM
ncbi:hypothetical protein WJX81_002021 [Elliptochloris bilobata]|uniref:CSE family protein n=1 Tax=Elliptochloris bilobata TaxID=381761 RepID=A0AAW1QUC8_9CHLO